MSYDSLNLSISIRNKVKKRKQKELGLALFLNKSWTAAVWREENKIEQKEGTCVLSNSGWARSAGAFLLVSLACRFLSGARASKTALSQTVVAHSELILKQGDERNLNNANARITRQIVQ